MALGASSEAGRAGDLGGLEGLPEAVDMERFGVQGNGCIEIDPSSHPPRLIWMPSRRSRSVRTSRSAQDEHQVSGPMITQALAEVNTERSVVTSALNAYRSRIAYLRDEATHDGYEINKDSEGDFRQFVRSRPYMRRGDLVLTDNGNLRAIWKDEKGGRLGLQFLGCNMVQYVIFKRRQTDREISRVAGRDSLEGIVRQINAFQLHSLLCE